MNGDHKDFKTAIYIRVSTDEQAEKGHSLDEQLDRIKEFCDYRAKNKNETWEIVDIYKEDGKSAKDMKGRPEFTRMINDIYSGKINNIVIYKLDRLTRSVRDLEEVLFILEDKKCSLMSVTEEINTSNAFGIFFIRMSTILAQLEIDQTRERTIMGLIGTVKQGITIGKTPLGYSRDLTNAEPKLRKRLIINEEEAKTIRRIFNLYSQGYSDYSIAKILTEDGNILRKWKDNVISGIINRRLYCGDIEHRKTIEGKETILYPNVVPAIISKDLFNECQRLTEINKKSHGSTLNYMFGKTLYCSKCNKLLKVSTAKDKGIKHYVCDNCKTFNEVKIEEAVLKDIGKIAEFNMALTYNTIMVDDDRLTEIINNIELEAPDERLREHKEEIRVLLDDLIVRAKKDKANMLWNDLDYEEKRKFITDNIEAIYIEKIKSKTILDYKVKVRRIKFKTVRMNKFFDLVNGGIIDTVFSNEKHLFSTAVEKEKEYVDNYVKRLRKTYNINIEEEVIRFDAYKYKSNEEDNIRRISKLDNENLFKIIRMPKSRKNDSRDKLAMERYIYISLVNK